MPIYEYKCSACQAAFEELIRAEKDERRVACPRCGGREVVRQPSVFATHSAAAARPSPPGGCGQCGAADGSCPFAG